MGRMDNEVQRHIWRLVRSGFYEKRHIVEIDCEEIHEPGTHDKDEVAAAVQREVEALLEEQKSWPQVTDCDRLDEVFEALNQQGVIALQNAGNTQSDGYDDVREIYGEAGEPSGYMGYCFYHGQDLERAVQGEGLWLAFGPLKPESEKTEGPTVGALIVKELELKGLRVKWNGTFGQRIFVENLEWKKRL